MKPRNQKFHNNFLFRQSFHDSVCHVREQNSHITSINDNNSTQFSFVLSFYSFRPLGTSVMHSTFPIIRTIYFERVDFNIVRATRGNELFQLRSNIQPTNWKFSNFHNVKLKTNKNWSSTIKESCRYAVVGSELSVQSHLT